MNEMKGLYEAIAGIGRRLGADRVVLYGSRARGDNRPRSDIDIAVFGAPAQARSVFLSELEALPTLLDFDLVFVSDDTDPALLENIKRDGVILMDKLREKSAKLNNAVLRLEESLRDYDTYPIDTVRDGVIQRFEICSELAWKAVREYLIDQGYEEVNSPKAVMKKAYADGLITEEQGWLALLDARNQTSHIYDEATAASVFRDIRERYCPLFRQLVTSLAQ